MNFMKDKKGSARFALRWLTNLLPDLQSITITKPEKSGGSYVVTVTIASSEGIETQTFSVE